jgi:hypothetical protein
MATGFDRVLAENPAQVAVGAVGFFASMVLVRYLGLSKDWGTLVVVVGIAIPVLLFNWLSAKKRGGSNLS